MVQSEGDKYLSIGTLYHFLPYVSAIRLYFIGAGSVVLCWVAAALIIIIILVNISY